MATALEQKIKNIYNQKAYYLCGLRELVWCPKLCVALISKEEMIHKICFFETKEVKDKHPDWHTATGIPFFVQDILGHTFFSQLLDNDSCPSSIDIEMYTENENIGFQQIPLEVIAVLMQSIQLESQLLQWNQNKKSSLGICHALQRHSGVSMALVPVRMYDLGENDNIMPILLKIPKFMEDGSVGCVAFTGPDRRVQAEEKLEQAIRLGYKISKMSLSGTEFLQHFYRQKNLHNVSDGILWNPYTEAEFFLPWEIFFSWFETD